MKIKYVKKAVAIMGVAGLALLGTNAWSQNSPATLPVTGGAAEILKLARAKVGDDTMIAFIKNSNDSYSLNADQIIYMRQQGISDVVIKTMLDQPKYAVAASTTATAAPQSTATVNSVQSSTATVAPTVTYVQTVPTTYYYAQPYYYPAFGFYPGVALSFGWGGGGWARTPLIKH